jgi:transcription factor TFIIIB component B''
MLPEGTDAPPARPMPGFRPVSRVSAAAHRDRSSEVHTKSELDSIPLSELIRRNFGLKPTRAEPERDEAAEGDELIGDTNFDNAGISADFYNTFQGFDEDEMRAEGFETTNQYQKAEFNEPPPRRFGSKVKRSTPRWKPEETALFYRVLSMCGTDFSMISKFFPERTRKMIVNKFHSEETKNKDKIQAALANPQPLDLGLYAATVGIDEASIIDDFKKNRDKLRTPSQIPSQPRHRPKPKEEDEMSGNEEWTDIESEDGGQKEGSGDGGQKEGSGDEIEGNLDF